MGSSKNPLTNGIRVYAAKPDFRRAPVNAFRDALNQNGPETH